MKTLLLLVVVLCSIAVSAQREKIDNIKVETDVVTVSISGESKHLQLRNKVLKNINESEKYYSIGEEKLRHSVDYYVYDDKNGNMYNIKEWVTSFDIVYTIENND